MAALDSTATPIMGVFAAAERERAIAAGELDLEADKAAEEAAAAPVDPKAKPKTPPAAKCAPIGSHTAMQKS